MTILPQQWIHLNTWQWYGKKWFRIDPQKTLIQQNNINRRAPCVSRVGQVRPASERNVFSKCHTDSHHTRICNVKNFWKKTFRINRCCGCIYSHHLNGSHLLHKNVSHSYVRTIPFLLATLIVESVTVLAIWLSLIRSSNSLNVFFSSLVSLIKIG